MAIKPKNLEEGRKAVLNGEAVEVPGHIELTSGKKAIINTWALRPGIKHLETVRRLATSFVGISTAKTEEEALACVNLTDLADAELDAVIEMVDSGCNLGRAAVESLSPGDFVLLAFRIVELNVRPLKGLREAWKSSK